MKREIGIDVAAMTAGTETIETVKTDAAAMTAETEMVAVSRTIGCGGRRVLERWRASRAAMM